MRTVCRRPVTPASRTRLAWSWRRHARSMPRVRRPGSGALRQPPPAEQALRWLAAGLPGELGPPGPLPLDGALEAEQQCRVEVLVGVGADRAEDAVELLL